jgi:hypothetical protein
LGPDDADEWMVEAGGGCFGPVPRRGLAQWASEGRLSPSARVRRLGAEDWRLPAEVPELANLPFLSPPKPASHDPEAPVPPSPMTPTQYLAAWQA